MWPQKWKASAFCARIASSTKPPPATARIALPLRARKPRRELASATRSLSTDERLELVERIERALREHDAVGVEHDRVGAAGHGERLPRIGVVVLVERGELDPRVVSEQPQRRLERRAERARTGGEDGDLEPCLALEALDEGDAAAELRAFVVEREGSLRPDGQAELADLAREREQREGERGDAEERYPEAEREPPVSREAGVGQERERREGGGECRGARDAPPADPAAAAEAAARRAGPT